MLPALASPRPEATASAASRSRSVSSGVLRSCGKVASSLVTGNRVKLVIRPSYHGFYSSLKRLLEDCAAWRRGPLERAWPQSLLGRRPVPTAARQLALDVLAVLSPDSGQLLQGPYHGFDGESRREDHG